MHYTEISQATASVNGTSFHNGYVRATYKDLLFTFGKPNVLWDEKVTYTWDLEYSGTVFTVYDWKEFNIEPTDEITWHIGTHTYADTVKIVNALAAAGLNAYVK